MSLITAYKPQLLALAFETTELRTQADVDKRYGTKAKLHGGYNPTTRSVSPLRFAPTEHLSFYLDSITGAIEAGLVDEVKWPTQLFATPADLKSFLTALSSYDAEFRIHDRWYAALGCLGGFEDGGSGITDSKAIASELAACAEELQAV